MNHSLLPMPASLRQHVSDVVGARSEEQVCRVDAWRVVAAMQYPEAIGDRAIGELPRGAMRAYPLAAIGAELTVAFLGARCSPFPAVSGLVNMRPESFFGVSLLVAAIARYRAVLADALFDLGWDHRKLDAALRANAKDALRPFSSPSAIGRAVFPACLDFPRGHVERCRALFANVLYPLIRVRGVLARKRTVLAPALLAGFAGFRFEGNAAPFADARDALAVGSALARDRTESRSGAGLCSERLSALLTGVFDPDRLRGHLACSYHELVSAGRGRVLGVARHLIIPQFPRLHAKNVTP